MQKKKHSKKQNLQVSVIQFSEKFKIAFFFEEIIIWDV